MNETVKFSDQSAATPLEKVRRYLTHVANKKPNNPYFYDDGYPRESIADDAAAALSVLEQLAASHAQALRRGDSEVLKEYAEWVPVTDRLPEPGLPVLLDVGGKFPIRAMWAAKHTVPARDDDIDWAEYVEADDAYYSPEGWYEWNQHEETHWAVSTTPLAWTHLPATHSLRTGGK